MEEKVARLREMVRDIPRDITVAVMGCVVNGPGEAREADYGIAGGKGKGLLFKKGQVLGTYPYAAPWRGHGTPPCGGGR